MGGDFRAVEPPRERLRQRTHTRRIDRYGILPYDEDAMKQVAIPTARLEARLPYDVMARLKRAAEIQGRTLTDFVVAAADDAACRAIQESEIIRLSIEGQRQIAAAILSPPAPSPALKRAAKRYRELFGAA
jgi:uncharacterized protein (DUF1778 family)